MQSVIGVWYRLQGLAVPPSPNIDDWTEDANQLAAATE
jgi:hypothetical protein